MMFQVFCKRFLRGVCLEQTPGGKPPSAIDAMEAYVRLSGLCTMGSTRVHGTSSAKQAASHRHHLTSLPSHSPTLHHPCCTHAGTAALGDALIYDSRLIHWGGENRADHTRHIISFTYAQCRFLTAVHCAMLHSLRPLLLCALRNAPLSLTAAAVCTACVSAFYHQVRTRLVHRDGARPHKGGRRGGGEMEG